MYRQNYYSSNKAQEYGISGLGRDLAFHSVKVNDQAKGPPLREVGPPLGRLTLSQAKEVGGVNSPLMRYALFLPRIPIPSAATPHLPCWLGPPEALLSLFLFSVFLSDVGQSLSKLSLVLWAFSFSLKFFTSGGMLTMWLTAGRACLTQTT